MIHKNNKKLIYSLTLGLFLPVGLFGLMQTRPAKSNFVSPISDNQQLEPSTKPNRVYQMDYYLSLSNSFLQKATRLANDNPNQTSEDKQKILSIINESLKAADQAIEYWPNSPEAYLNRSNIYKTIQHLIPEAGQKAENDIQIAKSIMKDPHASFTPQSKNKPLDLVPAEKAQVAKNIIIAEPKEAGSKINDLRSTTETNALLGTGMLMAGETEVIIENTQFKENDLIYVAPKGDDQNQVLYIKSRAQGEWFKVGIDKALDKDLEFRWWLIKND